MYWNKVNTPEKALRPIVIFNFLLLIKLNTKYVWILHLASPPQQIKGITFKTAQMANPLLLGFAAYFLAWSKKNATL